MRLFALTLMALAAVPSAAALGLGEPILDADASGLVPEIVAEPVLDVRLPDPGTVMDKAQGPPLEGVAIVVDDELPITRTVATDLTVALPPPEEPATPVAVAAAGTVALTQSVAAAGWARSGLLGSWTRLGARWVHGLTFLTPLFSRIERLHVLDNAVRAHVHESILAEPGLSIREIQRRVGIAWGTTVYHLRRLEHHGLIVGRRGAGSRLYFPIGSEAARNVDTIAATAHPTARRIAEFIHGHPGTDQKTVCQELDLRNPAASKHLGRFERIGLVESRFESRRRIYSPTAALTALFSTGPSFASLA